jgi:hypothetical protein
LTSSLAVGVVVGGQRPAVALVPPFLASDGDDAVFLAGRYGLVADEWQRFVLEAWLGLRADGMPAAPRCGLSVPRQNGKNAVIEILTLFRMVGQGRRVLHTAHEVKTARKANARLKYFFGDKVNDPNAAFPELNALVTEVRNTNGQEAIVLRNGGSVEFAARSRSSGRGFSVDDLILDEAQELSEDALAALRPTISASPDPQIVYTGTPPGPTAVGEVFTRIRKEGLDGKSRRLCWMEWRAADNADIDDPVAVAAANPAVGIRLLWETIEDERGDLDEATFARERLGMWESKASIQVVNPDLWTSLKDPPDVTGAGGSKPSGPVMFAADISPDRQRGSVSVGAVRADGLLHGEVAVSDRGTAWMAPWLVERVAKWRALGVVIDPGSPAGSLVPELQKAGLEPILMTLRDVGTACGLFYDAAVSKRLRHLDDPRLNTALAGARKRNIGTEGLWAWHRRDSTTDITPLVSVTNALWGFQAKRPESKVRRAVGSGRSY